MIYLYSKLVYQLWFRPISSSTIAQQNHLRYCKKSARLVVTVSVIYSVCVDPSVGYLCDIFVYEPTDIFLCTHDKYSVCNTQLRYKPSAV